MNMEVSKDYEEMAIELLHEEAPEYFLEVDGMFDQLVSIAHENPDIVCTPVMVAAIQQKWKAFGFWYFFAQFAFFLLLLATTAHSVWRSKHPPLQLIFLYQVSVRDFPFLYHRFRLRLLHPVLEKLRLAILPNALYFSRVSLSHFLERFFLYIDRCPVRVGWHALEKTIIVTITITTGLLLFAHRRKLRKPALSFGVFLGKFLTRISGKRHLHKRYERGLRTGRDRRIFGEL